MNRISHFFLAFALMFVVAPRIAFAQSPQVPAADASSYFRLGEMFEASRWYSYYHATGANLGKRLKDFEELTTSLGAPPAITDVLRTFHGKISKYPHATPYMQWPDAQRSQWLADAVLDQTPWTDWLRGQGLDRLFLWWLGRMSFQTWFIRVKDVTDDGWTPQDIRPHFSALSLEFQGLANDVGYIPIRKRLNPEALAQLRFLADLRARLQNPATQFGQEDVAKIDAAARSFRALAQQKKLVVTP